MKLEDILPIDDYPSLEWAGRAPTNWLWDFERERFEKNGGHELYGPKDVEYRFNSYGYRCPEFTERASLNIAAIGCSYVFGTGLPEHTLFHQVIAKEIGRRCNTDVCCFNLGMGGAGNDYIARTTALVIPRLKPDLVLINFTWLARREYIAPHNLYWNFLPGVDPTWDLGLSECAKHLSSLTNPHDNMLNFIRNYQAIDATLADIPWLFSANSEAMFPEELQRRVDMSRFAGYLIDGESVLDLARDNSHPGPKTHEALSDQYAKLLSERKILI